MPAAGYASGEDAQVVGDPVQVTGDMGGEQDRVPFVGGHELGEDVDHVSSRARVEAAGWFVEDQQPWPPGQREREGELGALTTRERADPGVGGDAEPFQQVGEQRCGPARSTRGSP
jgi:hypothetical protein